MPRSIRRVLGHSMIAALLSAATASSAPAATWFVAPGGTGDGSAPFPFGRIRDALAAAQAGDVISLAPGTYPETLATVRPGSPSAPITLRSAVPRGALITHAGRVFTARHPWFVIEDVVLDGQYGASDLLRVEAAAQGFTLRGSELRRTSRDAIDIGAASDVLIEGSLIHHALNAADGRTDAHGIVAGAVRRLAIRTTEIHTFSGDGVQVDPGRSAPGWSEVLIERCRIWLAPLPAAANGFARGVVPGENALDTKADPGLPRATITVVDTEAFGFRGGLISNMAAFNVKEHVDATFDRVTVYDSEIAFRLRGPGTGHSGARVRVQNAVVHSSATAFRYEDAIEQLRIWHTTIGRDVVKPFVRAGSAARTLDVRSLLVLGPSLPAEAAAPSNLAVTAAAFLDAPAHDYRLAPASPAVDAGAGIAGVGTDRLGVARPQGPAADVGAYEQRAAFEDTAATEIVLHAASASQVQGNWRPVADATAAGGVRLASANRSQPALTAALADPPDAFELTFTPEAGRLYRLWVRGKAKNNLAENDSVFVQFSGAVAQSGSSLYGIGTTSAAVVELSPCSGCRPAGWGWQTAGPPGGSGGLVRFNTSGRQTLRVQIREDGLSIDQVVLSAVDYLLEPPGRDRKDTTILPERH